MKVIIVVIFSALMAYLLCCAGVIVSGTFRKADGTNHKGKHCKYRVGLFCQEGYCSECAIYQEWLNHPDGLENKKFEISH